MTNGSLAAFLKRRGTARRPRRDLAGNVLGGHSSLNGPAVAVAEYKDGPHAEHGDAVFEAGDDFRRCDVAEKPRAHLMKRHGTAMLLEQCPYRRLARCLGGLLHTIPMFNVVMIALPRRVADG